MALDELEAPSPRRASRWWRWLPLRVGLLVVLGIVWGALVYALSSNGHKPEDADKSLAATAFVGVIVLTGWLVVEVLAILAWIARRLFGSGWRRAVLALSGLAVFTVVGTVAQQRMPTFQLPVNTPVAAR